MWARLSSLGVAFGGWMAGSSAARLSSFEAGEERDGAWSGGLATTGSLYHFVLPSGEVFHCPAFHGWKGHLLPLTVGAWKPGGIPRIGCALAGGFGE